MSIGYGMNAMKNYLTPYSNAGSAFSLNGKVALAAFSLTAFCFTHSSHAETVVGTFADAYVKDGASAGSNTGSSNVLELAARGVGNNRKIYQSYDLGSLTETAFDGSFLSLSVQSVAGTVSALNEDDNISISIYGIVDSTPGFTEESITWSNAPKNDTSSWTSFVEIGTNVTALGTITIDATAAGDGTLLVLQTEELENYLSWATGNLGDYYGTGATAAAGNIATIMIGITAIDTPNDPLFRFYSSEGALAADNAAYAPSLTVIPETSTANYVFGLLGTGSLALWIRRRPRK